ncbi:GNAT family N-acetyltransferase [Yoonia sp. R2331]|uniref:GNAT family N-acetyltransferase n=1 Tax=Yoonia sp. R2331 TaxID=3237238 RepID=UPI0034E55D2B
MSETYRSIRPADYDDLYALASRWEVVRQLGGWKWPPDPVQIRERSKPYDGDGFVWAICRDDRLIGTISVTRGDLGYALHPDHQGQGVMGRATRKAVATAFSGSDRDHITGSTWHDNPASARVLERLGFVHWQTVYIRSIARGLPTLVHQRRLTRAAWQTLEKRQQLA